MTETLLDNLIIEDLCYKKDYLDLWYNTLEKISGGGDYFRENYQNLNPEMFLSLPVVIKDNRIICFSGLQVNDERWGKGIGRISSRMWVDPEYRFEGMVRFTGGNRFLNSYYCLPVQIEKAKHYDLKCLFISRQHNPQGLQEYFKLIKTNCGIDFELEKAKYNVCGAVEPIPESCKQFIGVWGDRNLWNLNMSVHRVDQ